MSSFTPTQLALISEPHVAQFVTLMKDGSPQISPVWIDTDGVNLLINTATGRLKTSNIKEILVWRWQCLIQKTPTPELLT